jgi:hypothetical protein
MTGIDRRLFVFGLCGVGLTGTPLGRINSVFAATKFHRTSEVCSSWSMSRTVSFLEEASR